MKPEDVREVLTAAAAYSRSLRKKAKSKGRMDVIAPAAKRRERWHLEFTADRIDEAIVRLHHSLNGTETHHE